MKNLLVGVLFVSLLSSTVIVHTGKKISQKMSIKSVAIRTVAGTFGISAVIGMAGIESKGIVLATTGSLAGITLTILRRCYEVISNEIGTERLLPEAFSAVEGGEISKALRIIRVKRPEIAIGAVGGAFVVLGIGKIAEKAGTAARKTIVSSKKSKETQH